MLIVIAESESTKSLDSWHIDRMAAPSSTPPASGSSSGAKRLRPELADLVRTLAALPSAERERVYLAVDDERERARRILPWDEWEKARGTVSLGGNAVEDCDELYDGP
jgi:hypothetical protein